VGEVRFACAQSVPRSSDNGRPLRLFTSNPRLSDSSSTDTVCTTYSHDKTNALIRELEAQHSEARRSLRRPPARRPRYTPEQLAEVPF
jgi:hypothetical protein